MINLDICIDLIHLKSVLSFFNSLSSVFRRCEMGMFTTKWIGYIAAA